MERAARPACERSTEPSDAELGDPQMQSARSRHPALIALWLALVVGYLAASASGSRTVAMVLVALMVGALLAASARWLVAALSSAALVGLSLYFSDSMQFIFYAPPLAAFAFMAFFFGRTLRPGSEALITRVARREHPDLPLEMARYSRLLTGLWALCFALLFVVALLLAAVLPGEAWSRWVHGLGYVVPGLFFLGEHGYRHYRFRERQHSSLLVLIRNIVIVSKEAAIADDRADAGAGR